MSSPILLHFPLLIQALPLMQAMEHALHARVEGQLQRSLPGMGTLPLCHKESLHFPFVCPTSYSSYFAGAEPGSVRAAERQREGGSGCTGVLPSLPTLLFSASLSASTLPRNSSIPPPDPPTSSSATRRDGVFSAGQHASSQQLHRWPCCTHLQK